MQQSRLRDAEKNGISWLEADQLRHPAAAHGRVPFLWRRGRLAGRSADEMKAVSELLRARGASEDQLAGLLRAYAAWVVLTAPGGGARLSGAAAERWVTASESTLRAGRS